MGSVIDYSAKCPRCNQENAVDDYYYKTGEEYLRCTDCGYLYIFRWKRDENGKLILKDESLGDIFSNLVSEEIHLEAPHSCFEIFYTDNSGQCGSLETESDYQKFVSGIASLTNQEHNIKKAVVSRLENGKIIKETLFEKI